MTLLLAAIISLAFLAVAMLDVTMRLSPDGKFYVAAGGSAAVPTPYRLRWLPPAVCRQSSLRWQLLTSASLVAWGPLMSWYLAGLGFAPWQQLAGVVLLCGLPAMFRLAVELPILVDPPAFALALGAAGAWTHGHHWAALGLSLAAGACKETAPVFAAIWAWHPALLIGLAGAAWLKQAGPVPDWARAWLAQPFRAAWQAHRGAWLDWRAMLLPWGTLCILAPLAAGINRATLIASVAVAVGYGSLMMAQDRARLFGWAAPAVIAMAVTVPFGWWTVPALMLHVFNPYRGV